MEIWSALIGAVVGGIVGGAVAFAAAFTLEERRDARTRRADLYTGILSDTLLKAMVLMGQARAGEAIATGDVAELARLVGRTESLATTISATDAGLARKATEVLVPWASMGVHHLSPDEAMYLLGDLYEKLDTFHSHVRDELLQRR